MNWQPIGSAPRDGSPVWVKDETSKCGWAYFDAPNWVWAGDKGKVAWFIEEWMPLPEPPK